MEITSDMLVDLAINIVNIVVLFLVVKFLVHDPVKKFMDKRSASVEAARAEAEKLSAEALENKKKYEELAAANVSAYEDEIRKGEEAGRAKAAEIIEAARREAGGIVSDAKSKAADQRDRIVSDAKGEIASLSVDIAEKLLQREMTAADNDAIIDSFLSSLGKADGNA